jgi:hypothetical protein
VREIWESVDAPYAARFFALAKTEDESSEGSAAPTAYFTNMIADAAACVREEARLPVSNAETALAVTRYLDAVGRWR